MWKNYLKTALRNLKKNQVDSVISIGGLSLGIACCILLVLLVYFEWSFDNFHEQSDRIYRVVSSSEEESGELNRHASLPYPAGPALISSFPEPEAMVRLQQSDVKLQREDSFSEQEVLFADSSFFRVFSFELLYGTSGSLLDEPDKIVLSESRARNLFGSADVVGETVSLQLQEETRHYRVSGVAADPPPNSSISFEIVLPYDQYLQTMPPMFAQYMQQHWNVGVGEVYLLLNRSADPDVLESKFPAFVADHYGEHAEHTLSLQPLEAVHLEGDIRSQIIQSASPVYSWVLAGIAVMVLAIACINFMSLTLSRSSARINEIGVRKASGAGRFQLGMQFMGEALVTCTLSFFLGIILAELALPWMNIMAGKEIPFRLFQEPELWLAMGTLVLAAAIITGLYPALVLSRKNASEALKSSRMAERIPVFVKGLIVVQFTLAMAFVASAFIMHQQIDFITGMDLGLDQDHVVVIEPAVDTNRGGELYERFSQQAAALGSVQSISSSFTSYGNALVPFRLNPQGDRLVETDLDVIGDGFLETLDIEVVQGRDFTGERPSELENGALVNRAFVESMGWDDAVGREIPPVDVPPLNERSSYLPQSLLEGKRIIGVVEDFHYRSLFNSLKPLVLVNSADFSDGAATIWVKMDGERISESLSALEAIWKEIAPDEPFVYSFLDVMIRQQYEDVQRWRHIIDISSLFAIAHSCFGLFGMAALAAHRRTKEIGIRKVLGATAAGIVGLLSRDFMKLVLLGFLIAVPIAWFVMNRWLADFAYRIEIGPGIFLFAGGTALLIALATVSWQAVKASLVNPVDSLRSE